uniref:G-protein coupled receptors family 1 profile domain-containing protein n=1 Tax=Ditylum brightwellii TaxID=49249 RepID=A0A7S4T168_9STRA|mmetsp:Transcript_6617/g.8984  ORF Transcript_6617/g.8984 Transcript_6617/m.8984 type:complete len:579 (+) Transcript_6617:236-1972(+)
MQIHHRILSVLSIPLLCKASPLTCYKNTNLFAGGAETCVKTNSSTDLETESCDSNHHHCMSLIYENGTSTAFGCVSKVEKSDNPIACSSVQMNIDPRVQDCVYCDSDLCNICDADFPAAEELTCNVLPDGAQKLDPWTECVSAPFGFNFFVAPHEPYKCYKGVHHCMSIEEWWGDSGGIQWSYGLPCIIKTDNETNPMTCNFFQVEEERCSYCDENNCNKCGKTAPKPLAIFWIISRTIICLFSIISAAMIISSVCRSKKNRTNIQQRILAAMSVSDVVVTCMFLTGHLWATHYPELPSTSGIGNKTSCMINGVIAWAFVFVSMSYNGSLAFYYLLFIKFNWSQQKLKKVEKWLHFYPFVNGLISIIVDMVQSSGTTIVLPWGICLPVVTASAWKYISSSMAFIVLLNILCLVMIYYHVRKTEKRSSVWASHRSLSTLNKTKLVSKQCLLFFMVLALPWTFVVISALSNHIFQRYIFVIEFLSYFFIPTSGFLNCIVYFRMRYFRLRIEHPDTSKKRIIFGIVRDNLFPCWCKDFTFQSRSSEDGKDLEPALNGDGQDESEAQIDHFTDNSGNENSSH